MKRTEEVWFTANDGARFQDEAECLKRDALLAEIDAIMVPLGKPYRDEHCEFANGRGWIRHRPSVVESVRVALAKVTMREHSYIDPKGTPLADVHPSWWGRMLDGSSGPLERAWSRLYCVAKDGREYGQPYYASHQHEATGTEIVR